jgi:hypothetical protein
MKTESAVASGVGPSVNLACVAGMVARGVEYLWPGYLPLGKIVTLDGDRAATGRVGSHPAAGGAEPGFDPDLRGLGVRPGAFVAVAGDGRWPAGHLAT